jgi:hypothetical protein
VTTSTDLAVRDAAALAIESGQTAWTPMQTAAFGQLGIADAPEGDKQVLLHVAQRTGLDPFARQLYMIGRKEKKSERVNGQWVEKWSVKWGIQTGIEGFRVIRGRAEREEGVRGVLSRPVYYNGKGERFDVWFLNTVPVAIEMTYTVRDRNGIATPYTSVLRFDEYRQTRKETRDGVEQQVLSGQWATKPTHMLEKCVEADVYRKAFPQDYSGVALDDAMPPPDWDSMSDEEPAARYRQATQRRTPDAAALRQRAAAQTVTATATVIPPDPSPAQAAPPAAAPTPAGAGEGPPPPPGEEGDPAHAARTPARAQDGQVGAIRQHFKRLGYADSTDDRVSRLSATGKLAGHDGDLLTTGDLSAAQAAQVLLALGKCRDAQSLTDLLDAGINPEAVDGQ